jgi:hypothetical protein
MSGKRAWLVALVVALLYTASTDIVRAGDPPPLPEPAVLGPVQAAPAWTPVTGGRVRVTDEGAGGERPDVAYCTLSDRYLVVWKQERSIWGRFVDDRGELVGDVFEISRATDWRDGPPRVAYDPSRNRFLVIWTRYYVSGRFLLGRFVPCYGLDPALPPFHVDTTRPAESDIYAIAYGTYPDEFLVVWVTKPSGSSETAIAARRVRGGGGFPASAYLITGGSGNRSNPDVAYSAHNNQYLVVYDDWPKENENIYGVRLSAGGNPVGAGEFVIAGWPGDEISPAVAACSSEDQYAVVWHGFPMPGDGIWLQLVSGSGAAVGDVKELQQWDNWVHHRPLDIACGRTGLLMEDPSYVVAWSRDFVDIGYSVAREVSTSGALSEKVIVGSYGGALALAGGEVNHMFVWGRDWDSDREYYELIYARPVGNTKPKAAVTVTPSQGDSNTVFHFDASGSSDNTDLAANLAVCWDWESDGNCDTTWSTTKTIDHQFTLPRGKSWNAVWVTVEVTDGHGTSDKATVIFNLLNTRPVGIFTVTPSTGDTSTLFAFDASASTDAEDGKPGLFRWDWTNDGVFDTHWQTSPTTQHRFDREGTHTVRLEVQDSAGQTAWASRLVQVGPGGTDYPTYVPLTLHASP